MASNAVLYLLVKIIDADEDIVVPSFWYHEGSCYIPLSGLEVKAEQKEMFKGSWNVRKVKILSEHKTYAEACHRQLSGGFESESAAKFLKTHQETNSTVRNSRRVASKKTTETSSEPVAAEVQQVPLPKEKKRKSSGTTDPPSAPKKLLRKGDPTPSVSPLSFPTEGTSGKTLPITSSASREVVAYSFRPDSPSEEEQSDLSDLDETQGSPEYQDDQEPHQGFSGHGDAVGRDKKFEEKSAQHSSALANPFKEVPLVASKDLSSFQNFVCKEFKAQRNYLRHIGRSVCAIQEEQKALKELMRQRGIPAAAAAATSVHPMFSQLGYELPLADEAAFFKFEEVLKTKPEVALSLIAMLRELGGKNYKDALTTGWQQCASDELLASGTWTGAIKSGSTKNRLLKFCDSELEKTINKFVKFGEFADVKISDLRSASQTWVLKANCRLKAAAAAAAAAASSN